MNSTYFTLYSAIFLKLMSLLRKHHMMNNLALNLFLLISVGGMSFVTGVLSIPEEMYTNSAGIPLLRIV